MDIPRIRIDIEALGEQIHGMIMLQGEQVADEVKKGVNDAIKELDIPKIAKDASREAIRESVQTAVTHYFKYGKGHTLIDELVGSSIASSQLNVQDGQ